MNCNVKITELEASTAKINLLIDIIDIVRDNGILEEGGELIIEHRSNISFIDKVKEVDERNYGSSSLSFFKKASL